MEKRTPHCKLHVVKAMVDEGKVPATVSALSGAAALGINFAGIIEVVTTLSAKNFYKSMMTIRFGKMCITAQQHLEKSI